MTQWWTPKGLQFWSSQGLDPSDYYDATGQDAYTEERLAEQAWIDRLIEADDAAREEACE